MISTLNAIFLAPIQLFLILIIIQITFHTIFKIFFLWVKLSRLYKSLNMFPQLPCTKLSFSTLLLLGMLPLWLALQPTLFYWRFSRAWSQLDILPSPCFRSVCELLKINSQCVSWEEEMVSSTGNTCTTHSPLVVLGNHKAITKANMLTQNVKIGSVSSYSAYLCLFAETWLSKSPKLASNSQSCLSFKCTTIIEYEPSYPAQPNLKMNRRR